MGYVKFANATEVNLNKLRTRLRAIHLLSQTR